jgi:hypothetical protein
MRFGEFGIAVTAICALALPAARASEHALSREDMLDFCSPFSSADGTRSLTFNPKGSVQLTMDTPKNVKLDKPAAGSWKFEEDIGRVSVSFGKIRNEYELFTYDGDLKCVLVSGTKTNANLSESWFGEFEPQDPDIER